MGGAGSGRRRKPLAFHVRDGTLRPDRHGSREAARRAARAASTSRALSPPRWLTGAARAEWRRVEPALRAAGVLTERDRAALTGYCLAWALLLEAERALATDLPPAEAQARLFAGEAAAPRRHPAVAVWNVALGQLRAWATELGLSPSARARLDGGRGHPERAADVPRELMET